MGTGIVKGLKKAGRAVTSAGKSVGKAVDPAKAVARVIDKAADTFKDDEFLLDGESEIELFGVKIGRIYHKMRLRIADRK